LHQQGTIPLVATSKKARWYNHETERPVAFHFCNAITRNNLIKVNGFDERYATGHNWDDAELLYRIKQVCDLKFVATPMVIHQYHHKSYGHPDNIEPNQDNKELYFKITVDGLVRAPNKESIQ
jgi:GT2 family glycosyltransferase